MYARIAVVILLSAGLLLNLSGCGSARRAIVEQEDIAKVFPWPNSKDEVSIRVKPRTLWVNTCTMLGTFEQVEVTPETTFYMIDELGKKFAYTPSRSPMRRLAPVKSMEIRWPQDRSTTAQDVEQKVDEKHDKEKDKSKKSSGKDADANKHNAKPAHVKKGQNAPSESSKE